MQVVTYEQSPYYFSKSSLQDDNLGLVGWKKGWRAKRATLFSTLIPVESHPLRNLLVDCRHLVKVRNLR